jgi:Cd2+/Zn2+-exporting ATPase
MTDASNPAIESNQTATANNPLRVKISGMDCGACAMTIESGIGKLDGVNDVSVSFTTETMLIDGNVSIDAVEEKLRELGYRINNEQSPNFGELVDHRGLRGFLTFMWEQPIQRNAILVTLMVIAGILFIPSLNLAPVAGVPVLNLLFGAGVLIAGAPVFLKGFRSLLFAGRITIDLLMAIAAIGALGIGETGEAVTVILLFMLGEALEAYSAERARDSLKSLMSLQPQEATVLEAHTEGHDHGHDESCSDDEHNHNEHSEHEHEEHAHDHSDHEQEHEGHDHDSEAHDQQTIKPVEQVHVGDRVLVRPGQRIPVDGEVIKGLSSVNQAPVTGEDMPILKNVGDIVMAGTVNGEAALEVRVTRPSSEGTIARIAKLVEQAQAQRSPAERFIDRFARYYTPAVVLLATLVVAIPVLAMGLPFLDTPDGGRGWLYRGLTLLIIACPCALVISIPVTVVSGLTRLAQRGVLVKSGALLDRMADITTVAFDKTGTLTHGKPAMTGIRTVQCEHPADSHQECLPCDEVVQVAASVERASEHPVAHAIVMAASQRGGAAHIAMADDIQAHPGKGISGIVTGGDKVAVGSRDMFNESQSGWNEVAPHADAAQNSGQTVMYISRADKVIGYISVQDEIREDSAVALAELAGMNPPVRTVMLTGDNEQAAKRVAGQVPGIDEVKASLLPDEKLAEIEKLGNNNSAVAMVGDGINDAPALARADIGIAMGGGGTAQAMETADVVLMQDDLSHVAMALRIARKSRQIIKQNIALSLILKLAFLGLAIPGFATLWMAVVADVGATLLVTMNGMRLLRQS